MALIQHGNKLTALQVMQDAPVIPVIVLHDIQHAVPLARALVAGGIRMLEVTLRTPQALACKAQPVAHSGKRHGQELQVEHGRTGPGALKRPMGICR